MKFACMTCGAKYSVPDGRLQAAGAAGLRVRCSRCRAIMVVAESQRFMKPLISDERSDERPAVADDEETRKELRHVRPARAAVASLAPGAAAASASPSSPASPSSRSSSSFPPASALASAYYAMAPSAAADEPFAVFEGAESHGAPAALSASGVFRPLPGVHRQVTGLFFPELAELKSLGKNTASRVWYAAIDNRPRGPFSATEMLGLADKGKIRDATLVWRPGFSTWKKVKHGLVGSAEDLSWLRKTVLARKLRELDAQDRAQTRAQDRAQDRVGIQPVNLTRTSSGGRKSTWQGGAPGMPPPLPSDADGGAEGAADGAEPSGPAPYSLTAPGGLAPAGLEAGASGLPWRADELPRVQGVRRRQNRALFVLAVTAGAVAVAAAVVLALRTDALDRLASLLSP
jgi:predicted Zn finger-like uncharacterized protein